MSGGVEVLKGWVCVEGLNGVGKSTLLARLVGLLGVVGGLDGYKFFREPSDGVVGGVIRSWLVSGESVDGYQLALMFAADRVGVARAVRESVGLGRVVVSDRCWLSSVVYQGSVAFGLNSGFPLPERLVWLALPWGVAYDRFVGGAVVADALERSVSFKEIGERYEAAVAFARLCGVEVVRVEVEVDALGDDEVLRLFKL